MRINIIYQVYVRQHFSSDDFFAEILSKIDPTYNHTVSAIMNIYFPLNPEEVEQEKAKGRMIVYVGDTQVPNLLAKQLVVSFKDIAGNYEEVRDHLLSEYGEKASMIQSIEEIHLNQVN